MNRFFALLSALVICAGGASSAIAGVNSFADRSDVVASFATVGAGISLGSCLVGEAAPAPAAGLVKKITAANASVKNIESGFVQTKTLKASGKKIVSEGTLYFANDGRLSMKYSKPAGELLVVNGNKFHMNKGGKSSTFDTSKNQMMGSLAKTLTGCIKGCPQQVATDNGAEISEVETAEGYVVTLTAGAGAKRGYSKIVLLYRKSDCVLTKMTMEEVSGIATVYEMKGIKKNTSFPEDVFRVPGK